MKNYFLLPIFLFNVLIASAQSGTISGIVRYDDKEVVAGVSINLQGSDRLTTTDRNGHFSFPDIAYGNYTLVVITSNDQMSFHGVELKSANAHTDIVVVRDVNNLKEVVVEATSTAKLIEKKGFAVNVVETKESSLRNLQVNELLDQSVGVRIRQNGGFGSEINYNINGMSGNSVRIFIDGIPISTYGSSFDLNSIPPSMIERIEIYKGVVPGHLADDALGGAINIVLKAGVKSNFNVAASYGSFNTSQINFNALYRFDKTGFTVKASGFYSYSDNDYEVWGKDVYNILPNGRQELVRAKRFNDAYRSVGGTVSAGFTNVSWADDFSVGFTKSDMYKEVQHGTFMTTPYKGRFTESDANLFQINYNKKDLFTKGLDVNVLAVYGERHRIVNDTVKWNYNWFGEQSFNMDGDPIIRPGGAQQGAPTIANIRRKLGSVRSGLKYVLSDNHRLMFNHMYSFIDRTDDDEIRSVLERKFMGTREQRKSIAAMSYELSAFENNLTATIFFKNYAQYFERMNPEVQLVNNVPTRVEDVVSSRKNINGYGMAVSYAIWPKIIAMASAERGVRLPNENEIFGDAADNISENPNIRPESSYNFNLGMRLGSFHVKEHEIFFAVNGFVRDITDRIGRPVTTVVNNNVQTLPYVNQGNVKSQGVDLELNYNFKRNLRIGINSSKFNLTTVDRYGRVKKIPNEPTFTGNVNAQYTLNNIFAKKSELILFYNFLFIDTFNFMSDPYGNNSGTDVFNVPQQFVHDSGISYVFPNKKLIASFDVKNIFNKQAFDNYAVQKPGRAFYFKLNYVINNL